MARQQQDTGKVYATFLTHFKEEAAAEAKILKHGIEERLKDLTRQGAYSGPTAVFLDSDHLSNLKDLFKSLRSSSTLTVVQTERVNTRPWCLGEMLVAIEDKIPIVGVMVVGKKYDYAHSSALLGSLGDILDDRAKEELRRHVPEFDALRASYLLSDCIPQIISRKLDTAEPDKILSSQIEVIVDEILKAEHKPPSVTFEAWKEKREARVAATTTAGAGSPPKTAAAKPVTQALLTGSSDALARIWSLASSTCVKELSGHADSVMAVAFTPGCRFLATGSYDTTARLWCCETGGCLQEFKAHTGYVNSVALSPDGTMLITGSGDSTVRLWSVETGICLRTFQGHSDMVNSVTFSPSGTTFMSGSHDRTARLWSATDGICTRSFKGHAKAVNCVALSRDGELLATASSDKSARLWSVRSGSCARVFQGHADSVNAVAFSPDGKSLVTGASDKCAVVWSVESGVSRLAFREHSRAITSITVSPDGSAVATGSFDKTAQVWSMNGKALKVFEHASSVLGVAFSDS